MLIEKHNPGSALSFVYRLLRLRKRNNKTLV